MSSLCHQGPPHREQIVQAALPAARRLLSQNPDIQGALLLCDQSQTTLLPLLLLPDDPLRGDYSEEQRDAGSGVRRPADDIAAAAWVPIALLVRTGDPAGQLYRLG